MSHDPSAVETGMAPVIRILEFSGGYLRRLVDDVPEEAMASQTAGVVNHPAWSLGHLAVSTAFAAQMIGVDVSVPDAWEELFQPGSEPTPVRAEYPSKAELCGVVERVWAAALRALESASNERLDAPTPNERLRDVFPTVRVAVTFMLTSHVHAHLGQIAAWRAANDLPRTFI